MLGEGLGERSDVDAFMPEGQVQVLSPMCSVPTVTPGSILATCQGGQQPWLERKQLSGFKSWSLIRITLVT